VGGLEPHQLHRIGDPEQYQALERRDVIETFYGAEQQIECGGARCRGQIAELVPVDAERMRSGGIRHPDDLHHPGEYECLGGARSVHLQKAHEQRLAKHDIPGDPTKSGEPAFERVAVRREAHGEQLRDVGTQSAQHFGKQGASRGLLK